MIGAAYGLAYWAYRARTDRSAYVGLYLVLGFPAVLLLVAGLAMTVNGNDAGPGVLGLGLGLGIPLVPSLRRAIARVTPMDPTSSIDLVGLSLLLGAIGLFGGNFLASPDPEGVGGSVTVAELVVQVAAFVGLAYVAVGYGIYRSFREATARLGINRPSFRTVAIALGCVVLAWFVNVVAYLITDWLQPDLIARLEEVTDEITADVQNPVGALVLGLSAGVGEEMFLRGAVQPRFGLVLTSLLFALLHAQYGLSFVLIGLFGSGVILGLERKYLGTTAAIITHAVFNILAVLGRAYN